jgi:hypothetical protein
LQGFNPCGPEEGDSPLGLPSLFVGEHCQGEKGTNVGPSKDLDLTLAFVGGDKVHVANSRALLKDFVTAHKRVNAKGTIRFILPVDNFSETMNDLADMCLTEGWDLDLVGREEDLEKEEVKAYRQQASRVFKVKSPTRQLVQRILPTYGNPRVVLIADPAESDDAFNVVLWAEEVNVQVRSLLKGMDVVELDDEEEAPVVEDEEMEEAGMHVVDDDEEYEDEEEEDEEPEEEDEEEEEEEEDEEEEEEEPEDEEAAEDDEEIEDEEEQEEEDEEEEDEVEDEVEEDEEAEEDEDEEEVEDTVEEEKKVPPKKMGEKELLAWADKDYEAFKEYARKFRIKPGRGIRKTNLVKMILEKTGQAPSAKLTSTRAKKTTKKAPARKTAAKRAPTTKRAAAAKAPAKKATVAKKARSTTRSTASAPAAASTNGKVPVSVSKQVAKDIARALLEYAKS